MKKIFALLFPLFTVQAFSQTTTPEEYDFVTIGYKQLVDTRQPIKRGYTLLDMGNYNLAWNNETTLRGIDFKALYRDNDKKPCAIMAIYYRKENGQSQHREYFCFPTGSENILWERTLTQINNSWNTANAKEMYSAMMFATMKVLGQEVMR